uniref:Serpentine Receptor, class H n=1 Tax=Caenorhabditis tropicalis TaxID=1561998 RepID=A0A1I7TXZ3_9PELO
MHVFQTLPCLPHFIYEAPVFVLADNALYHSIICIFGIVSLGLEALLFIIALVWSALKQVKSSTMSKKTFEMQKKFFIALMIQLFVPFLLIFFPMSTAWVMILKDIHNQTVVNFGMIIISMHGVVSSLVMIIVHRPYREAVMFKLFPKKSVSVEVSEKLSKGRKNRLVNVT